MLPWEDLACFLGYIVIVIKAPKTLYLVFDLLDSHWGSSWGN